MKPTELIPCVHTGPTDEYVVEVWTNGELIGAVYAADGAGIRFVSKFPLNVETISDGQTNTVTILKTERPKFRDTNPAGFDPKRRGTGV